MADNTGNQTKRTITTCSLISGTVIFFVFSVPMLITSFIYFEVSNQSYDTWSFLDFRCTSSYNDYASEYRDEDCIASHQEYDDHIKRSKRIANILLAVGLVLLVKGIILSVIMCVRCSNRNPGRVYQPNQMIGPRAVLTTHVMPVVQPPMQNVQMMPSMAAPGAQMMQQPPPYATQKFPTMHPQYGYDQEKQG